jgi:hypothetical protein
VYRVNHPVPALAPQDVESALRLLGYDEPDLDADLPIPAQPRVRALLAVLLAVTEAHLTARGDRLDEVYFAVSDHLAEPGCCCSFAGRGA